MAELSEMKKGQRVMWAGGDYSSVAERIVSASEEAVRAAAVSGDDKVLDVACGTGNATIPAAQTGAEVTGLDLTPELLEVAKGRAGEAGVEIDWIEGDAEQLPFEDGTFDVVLSVFGCMFAPDHKQAAAELARVLKPGGRIAVCAWTPEGNIGKFFIATASHMPAPPEGFQPPVLWGTEDHVRGLFDGTGVEPAFDRASVEMVFDSVEDVLEENATKLPPLVMAKKALEPEGKWEALESDLRGLYEEANTSDGGDLRFPAEYLVISGKKAD
jgi:SAM-dependent methyltransferase